MRTDPIDSLIRRVAGDAEVGQGAIRLRLDQNGVVSGGRSLFGDFLKTFVHYDVFEERTAPGPVEIGPLAIDLPSAGGRAHLQVVLSHARVARGKAAQLATALFHESQTPSDGSSPQPLTHLWHRRPTSVESGHNLSRQHGHG